MINHPPEMEEYIKKTVNPVIDPLLIAILTSKPTDVVFTKVVNIFNRFSYKFKKSTKK